MPSNLPYSGAFCIGIFLLSGCAQPSIRQAAEPAPQLRLAKVLQAPEGVEISWDALKGKVVILEFWATWCAPCLVALEHHNELADQFEGQPVRFIAITDEEESVIRDYLKRRRIAGWVGLDPDRVMFDAFGIRGIPATVLVDRNGTVRAVTHPHELNEQVLKDVLADRPVDLRPYTTPDLAEAPKFDDSEEENAVIHVLIKESESPNQNVSALIGPGVLTAFGWTVADAVAHAFDTPKTRIIGDYSGARVEGDPLVLERKFDIRVRVPREQETLLKPLLREALKAVCNCRIDRRETEVYVLQTPDDGPTENLRPALPTKGSSTQTGVGQFDCLKCEIRALALQIEHQLGVPVFDETNLSGRYDWNVRYNVNGPESVIEAVREQLGLDLTLTRRLVDFCVVDELKRVDGEQ